MRKLMVLALPLAACSVSAGNADQGAAASGGTVSRDYPLSGFSAVELTASDNVEVRAGSSFAVHAQGSQKSLDHLLIVRDGDTLRIGRKPMIVIGWSNENTLITVTMPGIRAAKVTGSGGLTIDRVAGDAFRGETSGSGAIDIGAMDVQQGDLAVRGSGGIAASGKVRMLTASVTGSGDINAKGLQASGATVSLTGSGSINATVNGSATGRLAGSGDIDLGRGARCSITKSGSGDITCG